ncbi:class I SAM-dependent methyltransferase [Arsenicibacter rosenii]|uniref:Methyltransferase domain-containing protein n=1 Tax=Arsenicibacter rosenii TaxID=1750698 RepID=A0A1S2VMB2_9BACT|nr:class I SAM-dependent methyltransferase [Arsenicibacter rosenii]OIN59911.1 hypothetical protein BLX24_08680 [Arsenicibacter rosenii]
MTFDRVAPVYDRLASLVFGNTLRQAQTALLYQLPADASILLIGGGTGWLLDELLRSHSPRRVVYLEASRKMLGIARDRVWQHPLAGRVYFQHGTEADLDIHERFDVILIPFVVDLFPTPLLRDTFLPRIYHALVPHGFCIITDFTPPTTWWQQGLSTTMYVFFKIMANVRPWKLPDWPKLLKQDMGFILRREKTFWNRFIVTHLYQRTQ